jgi:alkanesulfonate monooxygenase SsuD/methylene tetrahydromethanopterin reductase-like flavin-dependent oxidoreductase (luciferase family)
LGFPAETPLSVRDIIECSQAAECNGFDSVWIAEGRGPEIFSTLAAIALNTNRIALGSGIVPIFTRSPWIVLMGAAVLDDLSAGRFTLGLGVGHRSIVENRHGLKFERPLRRLRETVELVRLGIQGHTVDYEGEVFRLKGAQLSSPPRRSRIPVYIAATKPGSLRLAGALADGVFLIMPTPLSIERAISLVAEGATAAGRKPAEIHIVAYVFTALSEDAKTALGSARKLVAYYGRLRHYRDLFCAEGFAPEAKALESCWQRNDAESATRVVTDEMLARFSAAGTPGEVLRKMDELASSGLNEIVVYPCITGAQTKETVLTVAKMLGAYR